jgi:hypothetical protein
MREHIYFESNPKCWKKVIPVELCAACMLKSAGGMGARSSNYTFATTKKTAQMDYCPKTKICRAIVRELAVQILNIWNSVAW